MDDTLETEDGRPVLRMTRRLAHPPQLVWQALTEPDQLSQWYPFRVAEMDLRVGGKIRFDDDHGMTIDAVITDLDPPKVFAFSQHAPPQMPRESDDLIRFELRPDGAGSVLVFTQIFDDRPAAASYATGWDACFGALDAVLAGEPGGTPGISLDLYQRNIQRFGLDRGTVEDTGDGVRVRFERQLMMVPVDRVWSALTGADVPVPGKPVPAGFTVPEFEAGPVTEVAAPDLLEYEWLAGRVRWELSTGPGGARVLLSQTVPSRSAEAALSVWRERIEALAEELTHPS